MLFGLSKYLDIFILLDFDTFQDHTYVQMVHTWSYTCFGSIPANPPNEYLSLHS